VQASANTAAEAASQERRRNLETMAIAIDEHYDLTIIVGTTEHEYGKGAFRVNRSALCHIRDMFNKMFTGEWAEAKQTCISQTTGARPWRRSCALRMSSLLMASSAHDRRAKGADRAG
jgi:hypothetical protein